MSSAIPDRNYATLLSHLHQQELTLSDETVQALVSHYLTVLESPTPLSATVISSPGLSPLHPDRWLTMLKCFRHSVHAKRARIDEDKSGFFSKPPRWIWSSWVGDVLKGTISNQPINKLACCAGLLLGLGDIFTDDCQPAKSRVEDQAVLALAECMDVYSVLQRPNAWEMEFAAPKGALLLSSLFAAQAFHLIPDNKLRALPLERLLHQLMDAITTAFSSGTFLDALSASEVKGVSGVLTIPKGSKFATDLFQMQASKPMNHISQLARLTSRTSGMLIEFDAPAALIAVGAAFTHLQTMAKNVETAWSRTALSQEIDETRLAMETREIAKSIWLALKTLLFTTIMISTACLSTLLHTPPGGPVIPPRLALATLRTLFHLSFVLSQFGGVTTTASSGFPELKQAFYLALDIVSVDQKACEELISLLTVEIGRRQTIGDTPIQQARKAYVLASVEQLIPVLNSGFIQRAVLPLCLPHLSSPTHRETYESAHSVILVIFATRAQRRSRSANFSGRLQGSGTKGVDFEEELIPFYTKCLLENSKKDALSVEQLCLAYSSLVSGACATVDIDVAAQEPYQYSLARSCVESLFALIPRVNSDQRQRLRLTLIACIPSLPLCLLPQTLADIRVHVEQAHGDERRELVDSLFRVISEQVGDREKEYVMRWWFAHQNSLSGSPETNVQGARTQAIL